MHIKWERQSPTLHGGLFVYEAKEEMWKIKDKNCQSGWKDTHGLS